VLPLAVALSAAACGGGGGGDGISDQSPSSNAEVPAAAGVSPQSLVRFLKGLMPTETGEPLRVGAFEAPPADTAEPEGL
jgi:hypothetical protein